MVLVLAPGAALAFSLGFRRLAVLGLAPVLSLSIIGVGAVAAPLVGLRWNIWIVVGLSVLACAGAWLVTDFRQAARNRATIHRDPWMVLGAAVLGMGAGALLIARRVMQLVGAPDNISQRYDDVFQLNAVRFVLDSGNGSTFSLGEMGGGKGLGAVYPAVWHDIAALLVQLTGASVPLAVTSLNLTICAVIWPVSVVFLTRVVAGPKLVAIMASGIFAAGLAAFPFLLLVWGPLFPNLLSVSVIPAALAVIVLLFRLSDHAERPWRLWLALILLVPGMTLAHMSAVGAVLAFSVPMAAWAMGLHLRRLAVAGSPWRHYIAPAALTVACAAVAIVAWNTLRPGSYTGWTPHTTTPGAIGEVLANGEMSTRSAVVISVLAAVGIFRMVGGRRQIWWLLSFAAAASLYVVDAAVAKGPVRFFWTGIWYADTNRLAAYLPAFAVVLAAVGLAGIVDACVRAAARFRDRKAAVVRPWSCPALAAGVAASLLVLGFLGVSTQLGSIRTYIATNKQFYERNTPSSILSDDEYQLLARIDGEVPANAVIAGNPWNGSGLVYAFADRKVLKYHLSQGTTKEQSVVDQSLNKAAGNPAVCKAIRDLDVHYVLDFGTQYLLNHPASRTYPGLQDLATSASVQLVDQQGAAKLYKVRACW
jgi:hypothetical protein